jgi:hypothetical protein
MSDASMSPAMASVPRDEVHLRRIELRGFHRHDGWFDIEARLVDTRSRNLVLEEGRTVAAGDSLHEMFVRLVVDEELQVMDVVAATRAAPFRICGEATKALGTIKGLRIGGGWSKAVRERLAGRENCTHLTELLAPLATVAFQTLWEVRQAQPTPVDAAGKPRRIDSCYAYASDREVVQRRWPIHYDGRSRS